MIKILDHNDVINRRQDERLIIVETAIHRVFLSYLFSRDRTLHQFNLESKVKL
ncbi:MAG: hypothetical protein V7K69_24885 [Nostoc sp.]|uniref:hypothetical protein n=1 Tax=Nostoc sp. TaxID=1180 RepID=UPI002FFBDD94